MAGILLKREPQLWSFDALIAQCKAQITSDFLAILRLFCKARKADRCRSKMSAPVSLPDAQNRYHWFRVREPMPIQKQIEPVPLWCWVSKGEPSVLLGTIECPQIYSNPLFPNTISRVVRGDGRSLPLLGKRKKGLSYQLVSIEVLD